MPRALVDTTASSPPPIAATAHTKTPLPILQGIDSATLPEAAILDYVLAETLNGLTTYAGHTVAIDFLDRVEENTRFHIEFLNADAFATAKSLFRQYEQFSFVDACIVAYMQTKGLGYLYAFDDDFDAAEDVYRLTTATNPYQPE